jgi:hypothetical protein
MKFNFYFILFKYFIQILIILIYMYVLKCQIIFFHKNKNLFEYLFTKSKR